MIKTPFIPGMVWIIGSPKYGDFWVDVEIPGGWFMIWDFESCTKFSCSFQVFGFDYLLSFLLRNACVCETILFCDNLIDWLAWCFFENTSSLSHLIRIIIPNTIADYPQNRFTTKRYFQKILLWTTGKSRLFNCLILFHILLLNSSFRLPTLYMKTLH